MKLHTVNSPLLHLEHFRSLKSSNLLFQFNLLEQAFLRESEWFKSYKLKHLTSVWQCKIVSNTKRETTNIFDREKLSIDRFIS